MKLKHLKPKKEFKYKNPDPSVLDTFPNPGVKQVRLECTEFSSLCPVTGQPDWGTVGIEYIPDKKCIESKSLKLYLGMYRQFGGFAEKITQKIWEDLSTVLGPNIYYLRVVTQFSPRGGISIVARKTGGTLVEQ